MDLNNINRDRDTSGLGPIEYDQSKVPALIRKYADNVRTKTYGQEVREAQARNAEVAGLIASEAVDVSNETKGRQDNVEIQFNSIQQELTDKDPISAPEIIAARNGEPTLSDRLDKENQEINTQLAHIALDITTLGAKADANYYNENEKKYYSNSAMTIPATDNRKSFQDAVDYLHSIGGGVLFVPAGKYCIRGSIEWKTKVSMVGQGMGISILYGEGSVFDLIKQTAYQSDGSSANIPEAWLEYVRFEDFEIDLKGLSSPFSNVNGKALFILYMKKSRFRNLLLKNTIGTALGCDFLTETVIENVIVYNAGRNWGQPSIIDQTGNPIKIGQSGIGIGTSALQSETLVIDNCHTYDCGNYGIFVEIQVSGLKSKHAKVTNSHMENNRIGFGNKGSGGVILDNCTIYKNKEHGITILEKSLEDSITNCTIEENGLDGIFVFRDYQRDARITNNHIFNNARNGILIEGGTEDHVMRNMTVSDNKIHNNGGIGLNINKETEVKHKNFSIKNNEIYNNNQVYETRGTLLNGIDGLHLIGNVFYDNQEVKTQIQSANIGSGVGKGFVDSNDFSTENDQSLINYSSAIEIGNNVGLKNRASGKVTFAAGEKYKAVNHFLGNQTHRPITFVGLTQTGLISQHIFPSDTSQTNRLSIGRENETYELTVFWEARVDY